MNILIHGDYHLASRKYLGDFISQAKKLNKEIIRIEGEKVSLNDLIQALSSNSLFGNEKSVVIENLFSRLKSKEQQACLGWLKTFDGSCDLILWEKKNIGKVLQRSLPPKTAVKEFKTPALIFKLVEQINPKDIRPSLETLEQALKNEPAEFIFFMISRQIRQLILIKDGQTVNGAPWIVGKLKKQAGDFTLSQLLTSYRKLYIIDRLIKRGQTLMPLSWHLEIWLTEIGNGE